MTLLPNAWKGDRLKDVALVNGSSLPANTDPDYAFDYLEISNVDYHGVIDPQAILRLRFEDAPSRARRRLGQGNTIISSVRPNLQAVAFIGDGRRDLVCSTGFNVVQPAESKLRAKFAYYALISEAGRQYFEATAKGVGYPAVDDKDFTSFEVPLPPLPEQDRIASYLDASCAAIDAAVAAKQRQIATLDKIALAELHRALTSEDWPKERIKDVASKIGSGVTPEGGATSYVADGIPLLRSQNVHFDGLRLEDVAYVSAETHGEMSNSQLRPRDVLLNITGASIGRCTFVPEDFGEGNVNQHVCIIRGNHRVTHRFLAAFLSSPMGQGQIFSSFTGASRQGLSHKELGLIEIPLPSTEAQQGVVAEIDAQKSRQQQVRNGISTQIEILTSYRKSLIHECVSGQRQVTQADLRRVQAHGQ